MSSVRSETFVVVPSVSRLTPEQKKESLFEAAKTGKKMFIFIVRNISQNNSQVKSTDHVHATATYYSENWCIEKGSSPGGIKFLCRRGREDELTISNSAAQEA